MAGGGDGWSNGGAGNLACFQHKIIFFPKRECSGTGVRNVGRSTGCMRLMVLN